MPSQSTNALKELKKIHQNPDERDIRKINGFEKECRRINALEKISGHLGIKIISSWLEERITAINEKLKTDRDLTDLDRKVLFAERDICEEHMRWYNPEKSDEFLTQQIQLEINYLKTQ